MAQHSSKVGSGQANVEPESTGSWSGNGASHEGALGVLDESAEKSETSVSTAPEDGSAFVAELVRAIQTIVDVERVRIAENTERRRQAQIDLIRARDTAELDRLRGVSAEDTKAIKTWVEVETKRIQREGEVRQKEVRDDLEASLAAHRSLFDGAVGGVETSIANYRAEVAAFFSGLDRETDLVLLAQQAAKHPVFPALPPVPETIAATMAEAAAEPTSDDDSAATGTGTGTDEATEPAVVGVMDPQAATEPVESWETPEASPVLVPAGASDLADKGDEATDPADKMAVASASTEGASLFRTVPALRPMSSWLRRDPNGEPTNRDD